MVEIKKEKEEKETQNIPITGRFDQYRSSYWGAKLAAFGVRYPFRSVARDTCQNEAVSNIKKHGYSSTVGLLMGSVTGFFAYRTWQDMRSIFAESLAWEFNKDEKDVGLADFWKSKNTVVQQTMGNYIRYNARRLAIDSFFFLPVIAAPILSKFGVKQSSKWHPINWHFETGADLGLGANAVYLLSDVVSRKITPFESLQSAIDRKINHSEHADAQMTAPDLLDIYERHAAKGAIDSFIGHRGSPEWDRSMVIFTRMADLINQTYENVTPKEKADFGISHFIYLVGHNLIQPKKVEQTLAYIEVANRYGMKALKQVVKEVKEGADVATALQQYPVARLENIPETVLLETANGQANEQRKSYSAGIKHAGGGNANIDKDAAEAATHVEKLALKDSSSPQLTIGA